MAEQVVTVFDADFLPYYCCHNKKDNVEKTYDECTNLVDSFINNINNSCNSDYYCGFITKGKCFRYDINPSYKANRKYLNPPKYLNEVKEYLQSAHNFTYLEGYEADDLLLSFERQYSHFKSILVSPDKDILTIGKSVYNPRLNAYSENGPYNAAEAFWRSMVVGDPADGIKGIPGKGKAYFDKIIYKWTNSDNYERDKWYTLVLLDYIEHFGEYEGIKEFTKNYLSLKIVDTVDVSEIVRLNDVIKPVNTGEIDELSE